MKKNKLLLALVLAAVGMIFSNQKVSAIEDVDPPALVSFSATPTTIDTTSASQSVTATFEATDLGGVDLGSSKCEIYSEDESQYLNGEVTLSSGDANDGTYDCLINFPKGSKAGNWYFYMALSDQTGNNVSYDALYNGDEIKAAVPSATGTIINNTATSEDTIAPALVSFAGAPDAFDTSSSSQTVTATFEVDDPAGFDSTYSECSISSEDGSQYKTGTITLSTGDEFQGTYECSIDIDQYSKSGNWGFYLYLYDKLGNGAGYDALYNGDDIKNAVPSATGTIISNTSASEDVDAPTLNSFSATPTTIDTTSSPQTVIATIDASDSVSGIDVNNCNCSLSSPSGNDWISGNFESVSGDQYTCTVEVPQNAISGNWYFYLTLGDALGNSVFYDASQDGNQILNLLSEATGTVIANTSSNTGAIISLIPTANPAGGDYAYSQRVTITPAEGASGTFYTLDGSDPTDSSDPVAGPIDIDLSNNTSVTLKAISYDSFGNQSQIMEEVYSFDDSATAGDMMEDAVARGDITFEGGNPLDTPKITFETDFIISDDGVSVFFPAGTEITKTDGGNINMSEMKVEDITLALNGSLANDVAGAIKIGMPSIRLTFSKPITVAIVVGSNFNGQTLNVYYQAEGETTWTQETSCLVSDGKCVFQTTHATKFASNSNNPSDGGSSSDSKKDSCGKSCKLYKEYKRDYKTIANKKIYQQLKDLRKSNLAEFNRLKAIYAKYKKFSNSELKKLDLKTQSDYRLYKKYRGYKLYLIYKDKTGN